MGWLGQQLYNARQNFRNYVKQPVRSAARLTPLGGMYKAAQALGTGQYLLGNAQASGGETQPADTGSADTGTQGNNTNNTNLSGTTSGSGSGGTTTTPDIVYLNGIAYDLNNAGDRAAFYQVKSAEIDKNLTQALQTGNLTYATKLAEIQDQMTQYMHDWAAQGEELGKGYNQGITARQQFFQGLGTRAYQSSMGTSGQEALNQLGQAQTERNYQKGIQEKQTSNATSGLEQAYNDWITGAGAQAQGLRDELKGTVTAIGGFNAPTQAPITSQADLSPYTPYTNFQSLASSPLVSQQKTVAKPVSQMTLSEWLQQYSGKSTNPLQDYLQGKTA